MAKKNFRRFSSIFGVFHHLSRSEEKFSGPVPETLRASYADLVLCLMLMCVLQSRRRLGREWSGVPPVCRALVPVLSSASCAPARF